MKLKVLPPTLRKNHHYLILDVKSEVEISKEDMLVYCWDACIRYWEKTIQATLTYGS